MTFQDTFKVIFCLKTTVTQEIDTTYTKVHFRKLESTKSSFQLKSSNS